MSMIYKIAPRPLWDEAVATGIFAGAPVDIADGYIHFSTAAQLRETARLHFRGQDDLVVIAFDGAAFGAALRYEASRNGQLFPHLYGPLAADRAKAVWPLERDEAGDFIFPNDLPEHDGAQADIAR